MPKIEVAPKGWAACWNCKRPSLTHVLPDVRLMKCPGCGAILPGETEAEFIERKAHFNLSDRILSGVLSMRK